MSSDDGHADASNNYGICLEHGVGVYRDRVNAAKFYRLAAEHGHADGANDFDLCFEHSLGINRDLREARRYYSMATALKHPEAEINYRRCCRLLGEWTVPSRSPTFENVSHNEQSRKLDPFFQIPEKKSSADLHIRSMDIIHHVHFVLMQHRVSIDVNQTNHATHLSSCLGIRKLFGKSSDLSRFHIHAFFQCRIYSCTKCATNAYYDGINGKWSPS
jgi:TPR repeat protein